MRQRAMAAVGLLLGCLVLVGLLPFAKGAPERFTLQTIGALCLGGLVCYGLMLAAWRAFGRGAAPILVIAFGLCYAAGYQRFSPVDEGGHLGVMVAIAKRGTIPRVTDPMPENVLALIDDTDPGPPLRPAAVRGLSGELYESFQPPLPYLVGAAVYLLVPTKARLRWYALRLFGVLLLAAVAWQMIQQLNSLSDREVLSPFANFALVAALLVSPGVLFRSLTVSNNALTVWLAGLALGLLLRDQRDDLRWALRAGFLAGALLLSHFFSVLPVGLLLGTLLLERRWRTLATVTGVAGLCLTPWLLLNWHYYSALTGGAIVKARQTAIVDPNGLGYPVGRWDGDLRYVLGQFWHPQEIERYDFFNATAGNVLQAFCFLACLFSVAALAAHSWSQRTRKIEFLCLGAVGGGLFLLSFFSLQGQWPTMFARYLFPLLPAILLVLRHGLLGLQEPLRPWAAHVLLLASGALSWSFIAGTAWRI